MISKFFIALAAPVLFASTSMAESASKKHFDKNALSADQTEWYAEHGKPDTVTVEGDAVIWDYFLSDSKLKALLSGETVKKIQIRVIFVNGEMQTFLKSCTSEDFGA